jgi:hypothetical protein
MDLRLLGERLPSELFRLIERILPEFSVFDLRSGCDIWMTSAFVHGLVDSLLIMHSKR